MARLAPLVAAAVLACASAQSIPVVIFHAPDVVELRNGFVRTLFNLTRGSLDVVQGRFLGDGNFSASPNLAGNVAVPAGTRRGALAVVLNGVPGGPTSTASFDRPSPLTFTLLSNGTGGGAAFSVSLGDAGARVNATLVFGLDSAAPRRLWVNATAAATAAFSPTLVALDFAWSPPNAIGWYAGRGVRQGMAMQSGFIASASALARSYVIGDGATGAVEALPASSANNSYLFAGVGQWGTNGGWGAPLWGAPEPLDAWVASWGGPRTPVPAGSTAPPQSFALFPNDWSFPPSEVPPALPAGVDTTDLRSVLTAVHGAVVAALHSYDFAPEVRAAPCLVHAGGQCYSPDYNFYDPDSAISNSAMLYSFDLAVADQVRGQLETNMRWVCGGDTPSLCQPGQCIHHFVGDCNGAGSECFCASGPGGVQDCAVYDAISGAVQTGPNVFQIFAALRYAGTTGDAAWLAARMPTLRAMMGFLDARFDEAVGLYNAPGSLQIDVFIRQNYTADSNAMGVILCELFADAEAAQGNATGAAFYVARAASVRAAMNQYLLDPSSQDHYCTQSDPAPGGGVAVCARDFVDYDANALAVAAGVPATPAAANAVLARMDRGSCTHAGRATYVSEVYYNATNCVGGNTGDSAVTMGRIGWQDALARQAVGDAAAAATFANVLLAPLQADLLRRTWLPERFTCSGQDTHNAYYFEYPATVALMLYEVKYGLSLQLTRVLVRPLSAPPAWAWSLGGLDVAYDAAGRFHAQLPLAASGNRTFSVAGMAQGAYTVSQSPGGATSPAQVGPDGLLSFVAEVGGGRSVDAVLN